MSILKYACMVIFVFVSVSSFAQKDTTQQIQADSSRYFKDVRYTVYPIVFFLPETSWGFGAAGVSTFRLGNSNEESKPSTIQLAATYTLKKQILLFVPYDLQFKNNKLRVSGEVGYFKYFFNYFGIGTDINPDGTEVFDVQFPRVIVNVEQSINGPHFVGLRYSFDYYYKEAFQEDGLLETNQPLGYDMGISTGIGLRYRFDTRDNYFYPSKGVYMTFESYLNTPIIGSDYQYLRHEVNLSGYFSIAKQHILAVNTTWIDSGENTPFFDLPYLAKPALMRGFQDRKYADRKLAVVQAEYRFPIIWRFKGAIFSSYGTVVPEWEELSGATWKWTYGAGLRFVLNQEEKVNIRLDFGFGHKEDSAFYLTIKEVF